MEVVLAGTVLALGLSGLFGLLGTTINEVKRGNTASGAQQNTVARLDQIRNLSWASLGNANSVKAVLSDGSSTISREVISVTPAAVPAGLTLPGPGFSVVRTGNLVTVSPPLPLDLSAEKLLNVTVTTEWSTAGASHQRQLKTLISQWGSAAPKPVPSATPAPTP